MDEIAKSQFKDTLSLMWIYCLEQWYHSKSNSMARNIQGGDVKLSINFKLKFTKLLLFPIPSLHDKTFILANLSLAHTFSPKLAKKYNRNCSCQP